MEDANASCETKQEGLRSVRRLAFQTNSPEAWQWLATFYRLQGFSENASYYERLAQNSRRLPIQAP